MSLQTVQVDVSTLPHPGVWRSSSTSGWGYPYKHGSTVHPMCEEDFVASYAHAVREFDDASRRLEALRIIRRMFSEVTNG